MNENPIIRFLKFCILIIMIGVFCSVVFTVWDAIDTESAVAGDYETEYTSVSTNLQNYLVPFLGIIIVGGLLYFILGGGRPREPEYSYKSNQCIGGECDEY